MRRLALPVLALPVLALAACSRDVEPAAPAPVEHRPTAEQRFLDWSSPQFEAAVHRARRERLAEVLRREGDGVLLVRRVQARDPPRPTVLLGRIDHCSTCKALFCNDWGRISARVNKCSHRQISCGGGGAG